MRRTVEIVATPTLNAEIIPSLRQRIGREIVSSIGISLLALCATLALGQSPGSTTVQGTCNAVNAGSGTVTVTCSGVDKKLANQIQQLVNESRRDSETLTDLSNKIDAALKSLPPAEPVVHIEPELGRVPLAPDGNGWQVTIVSTGVEIESIHGFIDFFWAEKDAEKDNDVRIKRILLIPLHIEEGSTPMGRGQSVQLYLGKFSQNLYEDLEKAGHPGIAGIRITMKYQRSSDKKDFRLVKAYLIQGGELFNPTEGSILLPPFSGFSFKDIAPIWTLIAIGSP